MNSVSEAEPQGLGLGVRGEEGGGEGGRRVFRLGLLSGLFTRLGTNLGLRVKFGGLELELPVSSLEKATGPDRGRDPRKTRGPDHRGKQ